MPQDNEKIPKPCLSGTISPSRCQASRENFFQNFEARQCAESFLLEEIGRKQFPDNWHGNIFSLPYFAIIRSGLPITNGPSERVALLREEVGRYWHTSQHANLLPRRNCYQ